MAELFGKKYTKRELLDRVGDVSQVCGIKIGRLESGRSRGTEIATCWTGSGLEFEVVLGRGMGVGAFRYKGIPLAWASPTGDVAPEYYEPIGTGHNRSYAGGLFHNSGLRNVGAPNDDEGEHFGTHGRIANIPADYVAQSGKWVGDDYEISLTGTMKEINALGEALVLNRKITAKMGGKELIVEDTVENLLPVPTGHTMLYHTNFGYPLVDEGTKFVIPSTSVVDWITGEDIPKEDYAVIGAIRPAPAQSLYMHKTAEVEPGWSGYVLANEELGIGIEVSYEKKNLPELVNWFNMETCKNVIEIGPSNATPHGRHHDRETGLLQDIGAYEVRDYKVKFRVLDGAEEIAEAIKKYTI